MPYFEFDPFIHSAIQSSLSKSDQTPSKQSHLQECSVLMNITWLDGYKIFVTFDYVRLSIISWAGLLIILIIISFIAVLSSSNNLSWFLGLI